MINYWIALSPWSDMAIEWDEARCWWYLPRRDKLQFGDKAVVYQPGRTRDAEQRGEKIANKYKHKFIGNFTVDGLDPANEEVQAKEEKILWDKSEFVDIYSIRNELEGVSNTIKQYGRGKMGLYFLNKTWIRIEKPDYDLILSRRKK